MNHHYNFISSKTIIKRSRKIQNRGLL